MEAAEELEKSARESSITGGAQIWRAPKEIKATNTDLKRIRGDLINVYKYMNNIYDINSDLFSLEKDPKPEATTRK